MSDANKTVSLALGSGGARGMAHLGVLRCLEENGYDIRSIAGSSIGSLVGGVYALDKLDEFENWVRAITRVEMLSLLDISLESGGLVGGDKIIERLRNFLGDANIEDLPIRFTAVATNIQDEKEVWISSGPLFEAIRASISLPVFFTPVRIKGVQLVDGGVLNPVPITPTFRDNTDLTIAVNLNGSRTGTQAGRKEKAQEEVPTPERDESLLEDLRDQIKEWIGRFGGGESDSEDREHGFHEVVTQSFETMQSAIARHKLAVYPPDLLVEIPRDACGTLELDRADEMIALGYSKAEQAIRSRDL